MSIVISPAESLRSLNTLAIDAAACALRNVVNDDELRHALLWARERNLGVVPLGEGSNVVLAGDIDALVIRQRSLGRWLLSDDGDTVVLRVGAGENWHQLVAWTLAQGYYGLENLALIPGSVGAAPIQNIGAYGVELDNFVENVHGIALANSSPHSLSHADCEFGYRDSVFKHAWRDQLMITSVELRLRRRPAPRFDYPVLALRLAEQGLVQPTPQDIFHAVVAIRQQRLPDPSQLPNVGSFFKNPLVSAVQSIDLIRDFPTIPHYPQPDGRCKLAAAWLIEQCGWKGHRESDVGVHPGHALVLVNYGAASGQQILSLAARIVRSVRQRFGISLEIEPRVYGGTSVQI